MPWKANDMVDSNPEAYFASLTKGSELAGAARSWRQRWPKRKEDGSDETIDVEPKDELEGELLIKHATNSPKILAVGPKTTGLPIDKLVGGVRYKQGNGVVEEVRHLCEVPRPGPATTRDADQLGQSREGRRQLDWLAAASIRISSTKMAHAPRLLECRA